MLIKPPHHRGPKGPLTKKILIYLQELYVLLFIKTLLAVVVAPMVVVAVQLSTKIQVFVLV